MALRCFLPTHARSLLRAACIPAMAVSRLETGVGSMGAVEYALAFSRFWGLHMARNSGSDGGHALPLFMHALSPSLSSSADNAESPLDHVSDGLVP